MSLKRVSIKWAFVFCGIELVGGPVRASDGSPHPAAGDLDEIVVTAEKREERLQDVPVPISVILGSTLIDRNQPKLQDYFATAPGLNLNSQGNGQTTLAIRGITTGSLTNPAVGVTFDDVPFGSSTFLGYGARLFPDVDPSDLSQIEVLRGPQGTLYGASSIGGLIKVVTLDPSTSGFSGHVEADGFGVDHGAFGYGVRSSVNLPVTDTVAIRASAFARHDPGFVDDPTQGRDDVNGADVKGGRLAALWRPSDVFLLKASAMVQRTDGDGTSEVDANYLLQPTLGDLDQSRLRGTGQYSTEVQLYSVNAKADFGKVSLTAVSGYGINQYEGSLDTTGDYGALANQFFGVPGAALIDEFKTKKFSQELRLASPADQTLEWLVGAFYTHENTPAVQSILAIAPATGATVGQVGYLPFPTTFAEYAAFGDLTVHFTSQLDVQFGARESQNKQSYSETDTGPLVGGVFVNPSADSKDNSFTYLVTPRLKLSPDMMVYARIATGYRAGGVNPDATLLNFPATFKPDKTTNYELGVKGDLVENLVSFDASAYYIDWKDIQIQLRDPPTGFAYFVNGGKARSEGLELSLQSHPVSGLLIAATAAFNSAELSQNLQADAGYGFSGDRLPYSAKISGSLSIDQDVRITDRLVGFVGASGSYVGDRYTEFVPNATYYRARMPGYADVDLRGGARIDTWKATLFVKNVADKRGIVGAGPRGLGAATIADPFYVNYIQPRTVGISVSKSF